MPEPVEDFLAHYGVRGMKWGVRKAASALQEKSIEDRIFRARDEKKLKRLLDEDLNPKRTAAKNFMVDFLKDHYEMKMSDVAIGGATVALGAAFMAYRINQSFSGISMSPIPLR